MPAGNGTGPMGSGPMTGRGLGSCRGSSETGFVNSARSGEFYGYGRGGGRGRGKQFRAADVTFRGRRFRNFQMYNGAGLNYSQADLSAENELRFLKEQAEFMQREFSALNERINELESLTEGKKENS